MHLTTILVALCLCKKSLQMVEFYDEKAALANQFICVNTALKAHLKDRRNVWIFSTNSTSLVKSLIKVPLVVFTEWDLFRERLSVEIAPIMIFLEGKADLDFEGLKRLQDIVIVQSVTLVCIRDKVCSSEMYLNEIVETVASAELRYIAIDGSDTINVFERTITSEGACGIAKLFKIGHCSDHSTAKKVFGKSVNFNKCPFRVVTWPRPIYAEICDVGDVDEICGIEGSIVQVVAKTVNATPTLLTAPNPDDVRQLVANRSADLGYGGLDTARFFEGISYSTPYMFVTATFIATHSTWTIERSLSNIFLPFGTGVWVGIGLTIISILVLRQLVPCFRRIYALQLFGIFLGIPQPTEPRGLSGRIYYFSLVLFGYFCSQSYLTNLTKVLSSPQQSLIETLDDLEHSLIQITGPADSRKRFKADYPRIYEDFQESDRRLSRWKTVQPLLDRFNWYSVAFVAPNTSTILRITNNVFYQLDQAGILTPSRSSASTTRGSANDNNLSSSGRSVALEFETLRCIFILHISGLGLSILVFVIEIVTSFMRKKSELKGRLEIQPDWSNQRREHGVADASDADIS